MYEQSDLALIGSRIKAVRTGKGMSQADLAVKASVSLPLISNIERGKTRMQLETFVKVAEALQDVDLWYLLIFKRFPYNSSKRADPNTGGKHGKHGAAAIRHRTRTRRG